MVRASGSYRYAEDVRMHACDGVCTSGCPRIHASCLHNVRSLTSPKVANVRNIRLRLSAIAGLQRIGADVRLKSILTYINIYNKKYIYIYIYI